jgi:hypothetical protein
LKAAKDIHHLKDSIQQARLRHTWDAATFFLSGGAKNIPESQEKGGVL